MHLYHHHHHLIKSRRYIYPRDTVPPSSRPVLLPQSLPRRENLQKSHSLKVHAFQLGSVDQDELNAPKIDISLTRIKKGVKIGEGAFGSVFLGELKDETNKGGKTTTTRVVLKSMNKKMGRDVDSFYQDELNVLNRLKNNDGAAPFYRRRRGERVLSVRVPRVDDVGDVFKKKARTVLRRGEKAMGELKADGRGDFEVGREDFVRVGG